MLNSDDTDMAEALPFAQRLYEAFWDSGGRAFEFIKESVEMSGNSTKSKAKEEKRIRGGDLAIPCRTTRSGQE